MCESGEVLALVEQMLLPLRVCGSALLPQPESKAVNTAELSVAVQVQTILDQMCTMVHDGAEIEGSEEIDLAEAGQVGTALDTKSPKDAGDIDCSLLPDIEHNWPTTCFDMPFAVSIAADNKELSSAIQNGKAKSNGKCQSRNYDSYGEIQLRRRQVVKNKLDNIIKGNEDVHVVPKSKKPARLCKARAIAEDTSEHHIELNDFAIEYKPRCRAKFVNTVKEDMEKLVHEMENRISEITFQQSLPRVNVHREKGDAYERIQDMIDNIL